MEKKKQEMSRSMRILFMIKKDAVFTPTLFIELNAGGNIIKLENDSLCSETSEW